MGVFYADDGLIGSMDSEWIQGAINVFTGLFRRVRMMANVAKVNTTTFQPGEIHTGISDEAFIMMSIGEGATYRERLRRRMRCPDYGVDLTSGYMTDHHRQLHGTDTYIDWERLPVSKTEQLLLVYEFSFLTNMKL